MNNETLAVRLPVLPIKRTVLFPGIMMPLTVGRVRSIAAVEAAMKTEEKTILVVAQRDPLTEEPGLEELYTIGTKAMVKQIGRSEDGTIHALVQGLERVALLKGLPESSLSQVLERLPLTDGAERLYSSLATASPGGDV